MPSLVFHDFPLRIEEARTYPMPIYIVTVRQLRLGLHSGSVRTLQLQGLAPPPLTGVSLTSGLRECLPHTKGLRPPASHILQWV